MHHTIQSETAAAYAATQTSAAAEDAIIADALSILAKRFHRADAITSPEIARQFLTLRYAQAEREIFAVVHLDNQHRVMALEDVSLGTIDSAAVYPREIVKAALKRNTAAVMLAHNHPSGIPTPSDADKRITAQIKQALALVDVRVIDHMVIGGADAYSFAEHGLL
ncbi:MAG: DNA repair protein RadC [Methylococcus sp.]|nr:DNA repair protein RadC [Methylococcus sp.]